jgi:hypothetical protein
MTEKSPVDCCRRWATCSAQLPQKNVCPVLVVMKPLTSPFVLLRRALK